MDEIFDNFIAAKRHLTNVLQLGSHPTLGRRRFRQNLGEADDRRQRIAQLAGCNRHGFSQGAESLRLDRLLRSLWAKATDENSEEQIPASRTALAIVDRWIKLNGLDAPSEHVIYNPSQKELEAWVMHMTEQVVGSTPEERDIIEAEYSEVYAEQQQVMDEMDEEDDDER